MYFRYVLKIVFSCVTAIEMNKFICNSRNDSTKQLFLVSGKETDRVLNDVDLEDSQLQGTIPLLGMRQLYALSGFVIFISVECLTWHRLAASCGPSPAV